MSSFHALMKHAIDYAGLYPPASLALTTTLSNYAAYRESERGWALGRLILPAAALAEFEERADTTNWPVSVVLGPDVEGDARLVAKCRRVYDMFECKLSHVERVAPILQALPEGAMVFFEVNAQSSNTPAGVEMIKAIGKAGAAAKLRMGSLVAEDIPGAELVAGFISVCARNAVPLKATAGLHHPVRAEHALTYAENAPRGTMHGFMNLMIASALLFSGRSARLACEALQEEDVRAFAIDEKEVRWRSYAFASAEIATMRHEFLLGFGSCSFTEPMDDSRHLGWTR